MILRARISRIVSHAMTSPSRRARRRRKARRRRLSGGRKPQILYFHQADDPYSHVAVQCLARLRERYAVDLQCHLVPVPAGSAVPERARLAAYALRDAARLAARLGLDFPAAARLPDPAQVAHANFALAAALAGNDFGREAGRIGDTLWRGTAPREPVDPERAHAAQSAGAALRDRLGHYLGAMFYFEGEWYWGADRLHYLETRLREEGLAKSHEPITRFQDIALAGPATTAGTTIDFWFSFRSPYSYLAAARVHRLAHHYGATLRWRFILPMVMRGLPVPRIKRRYIMLDTKREAESLGMAFGTVVDPVGRGVERALAVLHRAIALGRGAAFVESALQAAFADGIDLASDGGLEKAATRAGLRRDDVAAALADESWRAMAEDNRRALFDAGLWGAPTFRVNTLAAHWGQDRLWALEEDLIAESAPLR
jgi:2-hydroxychromene-2-carboxylate isomerase